LSTENRIALLRVAGIGDRSKQLTDGRSKHDQRPCGSRERTATRDALAVLGRQHSL
jgi:hypothetical protein